MNKTTLSPGDVCECNEPATTLYRNQPVCQNCKELANHNPGAARTCGIKTVIQEHGFKNSTSACIDWETYWLPRDFNKPICGDSLNALPALAEMLKSAA